jgi:hypothetical protein
MNEYSDYEHFDYDYDYNHDEELNDINSAINKFISSETDNIMNIYYDIKDRIPYFLDKLKFSDFLQFIIHLIFLQNLSEFLKISNQKMSLYDSFISEYNSEINNLLYIINLYIQPYKIQINYSTFVLLSLKYTTYF